VKGGMLEMVRGSLRWLLEDFLRTTYLALAQVCIEQRCCSKLR
jgi:hypothetical protein